MILFRISIRSLEWEWEEEVVGEGGVDNTYL
jgi:hypothetical protein